MTMSRFRQQLRVGHLERLKRIIDYLANLHHGLLRFRTHVPDYSNLPHKEYDWQRTVYSGAKEEIPHDIPEPKEKHVTTTTCVEANLHHDQVTGRAVTACLHIVNAAPSYWNTKRRFIVETATFGTEFVAARIATDQIIKLRCTLMYFGFPVRSKSYMFGDNKSVVDSANRPPPLCPRNNVWLHIIESEKPLLQDISNLTGKMENPTLLAFSANSGSLQTSSSPEAFTLLEG